MACRFRNRGGEPAAVMHVVSHRVLVLAVWCAVLAVAAEQRGSVKSAGLPIPGATVTARQGNESRSTVTDESGSFVFPELTAGEWTIDVEMTGFASTSMPVAVRDAAAPVAVELKLKGPQAPALSQRPASGPAPGFRRVEVSGAAANEVQAALNAPVPESAPAQDLSQNANESFLVNGSLSQGLQATGRMDDVFAAQAEMRLRMAGMPGGPGGMDGPPGLGDGPPQAMAGAMGRPGFGPGGGPGGRPGFGGPGGGPGGIGPGNGPGFGGRGGPQGARPGAMRTPRGTSTFGNRANRRRESFRGGASFSLRNSAMDARPYALSGQSIAKPSYGQARFSFMGGGALHIPKILTDDKTFLFVNYSGARARNPYDSIATVPTLLERSGDFSQSRGATIYDPLTGQPFAGNRIPEARMNTAARGMLSFIPLPNQPGAVQNYQIIGSVPQNADNLGLRVNRSLTNKDRLAGSFNVQRRNGSNLQLFGFRDTTDGQGLSSDISWSRNLATGLISNFRVGFSRNSNEALPFFAYGLDWATELGIAGTSDDPRNFGPPNLSFTNFGGLTDGSPSRQHNQTVSFSEGIIRAKGKHTWSFGIEYRRVQLNSVTDQNGRGTYTFSGIATSGFDASGAPLDGTGYDFADYLLGRPQSSSIRYGSSDIYFRSSAYNAYVQHDWRVSSTLTINAGLRYEFLTPLREKYGRMANLDIAPSFTGVSVVTPAVAGPYTGAFPDGLVDSDPNNLAPRVAIAWRPSFGKQMLVRAGYGWYYNGSVYNSAASRLAQQPPFAQTYAVNTSLARPLTIQDGFLAVAAQEITNTFAIDRAYRVGYAQTWNAAVQQDLPFSTTLEVGYIGTKGTRLDIQRLPNRAAPGSPLTSEQRRLIGNAIGFVFDSSDGNSIYHAGQVRLTRRFRRGISANALYTYSKSIDNASSIGGGGAVVVQDDRNLAAERGLSSFDRRHNLNVFFMVTTSGPGSGSGRHVMLRDWQLSGGFTAQSGQPFTATVLGNRSDAAGSGAVGSARADATGVPLTLDGAFFNPAAFTLPPATRYGNAGRNTIGGPSLFTANLAFGRSIRLGERRGFDVRAEANNIMNSLNVTRIGTTVNALNYGLPLTAASMRTITLNLRFRF